MVAFYNEIDPYAVAWLEELIRQKLIAPGVVDTRSILDVNPSDLVGFTQCHFFAGVGGWSFALRLAGVSDDTRVWTGSPPCQPFSVAGLGEGRNDGRHLAPHFISLVGACRPPMLFGEQVASAAVFGKAAKRTRKQIENPAPPDWAWLDDIQDRLEAARYAFGASDIPAASVGAPHIRQRTFYGAVRGDDASSSRHVGPLAGPESLARDEARVCVSGSGRRLRRVADPDAGFPQQLEGERAGPSEEAGWGPHCQPLGRSELAKRKPRSGEADPHWGDADWLHCRDAKWRPVEPGTFPLAHGIPGRVGQLRGYGNAIVPRAAAEFVKAFQGAVSDQRQRDEDDSIASLV